MNKIIATIAMSLIIILPLILLYKKYFKEGKTVMVYTVIVFVIWVLTYAPLHEISHIIGNKIVGVEITNFKLLPEFWKGDFRNAYIKIGDANTFQEFVGRISPYVKDIFFLIIGFFLLKSISIQKKILVGFILSIFILSSLYDLVVNFLGFVMERDGDFNGIANLIGVHWTSAIGTVFIVIAGLLTALNLKITYTRIKQ